MSAGYHIAYRLGLRPWERAGRSAAESFSALLAREEDERRRPYGAALDLGCGTGAHAVELAHRGWQVTAIDAVGRALDRGRAQAVEERVDVRFVHGDVTTMGPDDVGDDIDFFLDVGCFHGLRDQARAAMGERLGALAAHDATALFLVFRRGRRPLLPRGADRTELAAALPGWTVVDEQLADTSGMPAALKALAPRWIRLRRT